MGWDERVHLPSVGLGMLVAAAVQLLVGFFSQGTYIAEPIAVMGVVTGLLAALVFAASYLLGRSTPSRQ